MVRSAPRLIFTLPPINARRGRLPSTRTLATATAPAKKKEGDISDAFASLSATERPPLPDRFRQLKLDLVRGREDKVAASWARLLGTLRKENEHIAREGSGVIPQVDFKNLDSGLQELKGEVMKRGVLVVRGVIDESEARAYKDEVEEYVGRNPHTRAFPQDNPQVFELYWSAPQLKARAHPNVIDVQRRLLDSLWHASDPASPVSLTHPLAYADRVRIRQPGDAAFALGPHVDGGSLERWEKDGFGLGKVYDRIFEGEWEKYDAWDVSGRVRAVTSLYDGLGASSMFRMWQGWLSMSRTGPKQGTLLVNPLMRLSMIYTILRPFFKPLRTERGPGFLDESNWVFKGDEMDAEIPGAQPGCGQELNDELHPHLELERTMVHIPQIKPGDFVLWHCDTIHAVDKVHSGKSDSSVIYIPVCPVTETNAEYLVRQREAFRDGTPAPDYPGGEGESRHVGRMTEEELRAQMTAAGRAAFGLEGLEVLDGMREAERGIIERANKMLGF